MNIQHSSATDEWYSPLSVLVRAKEILGQIDLDPASDEFGNARVGARYFITKEQDGLASPWPIFSTVFINPPGGKTGNQSNTALFWKRLMEYRDSGSLKHAIFMCFSIEAAQNTQGKGCKSILEFPFCIPQRRIRFDSREGTFSSPSHSNAIIYIPGQINKTAEFIKHFSDLGLTRE
jgi:hypothetical protein